MASLRPRFDEKNVESPTEIRLTVCKQRAYCCSVDDTIEVGDGARPRDRTGPSAKMGWDLARAKEHRVTAAEARIDHFEFEFGVWSQLS